MPLQNLNPFSTVGVYRRQRLLEDPPRFSIILDGEIFIKRDDVTPMAMGGKKLRKLRNSRGRCPARRCRYADHRRASSLTMCARLPQSRRTGLHCVALLENPIWHNRRKLFNQRQSFVAGSVQYRISNVLMHLPHPNAQLEELATESKHKALPDVIPVGGSNALGALGYVESALEIAQQCEKAGDISSVVVASALPQLTPDWLLGCKTAARKPPIGVTVSCSVADQLPKVVNLQQAIAKELELTASAEILLWDLRFLHLATVCR